MKMTKTYAKEVLNLWKGETNYFSGCISLGSFQSMLRHQMQFGEAETQVITMALIMAGAKFAD